jgi:hypothetical protein
MADDSAPISIDPHRLEAIRRLRPFLLAPPTLQVPPLSPVGVGPLLPSGLPALGSRALPVDSEPAPSAGGPGPSLRGTPAPITADMQDQASGATPRLTPGSSLSAPSTRAEPSAGRLGLPRLGGGTPAPIAVTMPNPADPQYQPLRGWRALGPTLAQFAGIPTKSGLEPLESVRKLGQEAFEAPARRYATDVAAAKTGLEATKTQAETDLERAEAGRAGAETQKIQTEMGLPKPVADDKTIFTGPNNEKLTVQASEIGDKRVYSVTGGGAPTANSPTTAQAALDEYLGKQTPAAPIQPSGGLVTPTLGAGTAPLPMAAPQAPSKGWTMGEPAPEQRPASPEEIQGIRDAISASGIAPDEKGALLKELRPQMTSKELDTLSGRYEGAAGRVSAADVANKNREAAKSEAEATRQATKDEETVFAFDPKTKQRIFTTRGEAKAAGYTGLGKAVSEAEISKEEATTRQFNDVQMNVSRYKTALDALTAPIPASQVERMTRIVAILPGLEKTGGEATIAQLTLGALPVVGSQALQNTMNSAWNHLTPQEQELMTGYFRARGSLLAYQRALTGTGRTSQLGLQLEMPNLPEPYVGATVADKRIKAFQENIDVASKGLVRFPWLDSPEDIRKGIAGQIPLARFARGHQEGH